MTVRGLPFLFPIFGILLAGAFRPSELDWRTLEPPVPIRIPRVTIALPDGSALRFLGVPGPDGRPDFYLGERECPAGLFSPEARPPSLAEARAFCARLSDLTGRTLRLPTAAEWRRAARAHTTNAPFPWGYGPSTPPPGVHFHSETPPRLPGPAFGYGFRDLAGGRWEWTRGGLALGGAWSERDPHTLRIDHAWCPPDDYAGADVGFRILLEPPSTSHAHL